MKRIILCFDGTWNNPSDHTNVYHFYQSVEKDEQKQQVAEYFNGVGNHVHDRIRGGIFGEGISDKVKKGYAYLIQQYELGDEIFLVGFSRGAYTARSLVGLIRKAGLLSRAKIEKPYHLIKDAYELYRLRDPGPDTDDAQAFRKQYSYYDVSKEGTGDPLDTNPVKIKFLGVWDTVGSLGIPISVLSSCGYTIEEIEKIKSKQFHDVKLSGLVENAFHALAVDEHRRDYDATLWDSKVKPGQHVEQVWFVGAHTDVGGGGGDNHYDTLNRIALEWMQKKAIQCGLELCDNEIMTTAPHDSLAKIYDSYTAFSDLFGIFKDIFTKINQPYYREIGTTQYGSEMISTSVNFRLNEDRDYHPQNPVGGYISGRRENAQAGKL